MAIFTWPSLSGRAAETDPSDALATSCASVNARATSLAFVARKPTTWLPYAFLLRTIASVVRADAAWYAFECERSRVSDGGGQEVAALHLSS